MGKWEKSYGKMGTREIKGGKDREKDLERGERVEGF